MVPVPRSFHNPMNFSVQRTTTGLPHLVPEISLLSEWLYLFLPARDLLDSHTTLTMDRNGKGLLSNFLHSAEDVQGEYVQLPLVI